MSEANKHTVEGIDKLKSLVKESNICLFCTNLKTNDGATTRPMGAVKVKPSNAYFWDTEGNQMINFLKMAASVATGTN